jgi:hypothetical protein
VQIETKVGAGYKNNWRSIMDLDYHEMDMQLASANSRVKELEALLDTKRKQIIEWQLLAQKQRNNENLWKPPMTSFGHEMQYALRELHASLLDNK